MCGTISSPWIGSPRNNYERVKTERPTSWGHSVTQRLKVIQTAKQLFADHQHFNQINLNGHRKIAGLVIEDGVDYRFFGSMKGVGMFQKAINTNDENLSLALDVIPLLEASPGKCTSTSSDATRRLS